MATHDSEAISTTVSFPSSPSQSSIVSTSPPSHAQLLRDPVLLRDAIIGFSDGLTVPFALTAGLSSLGSSKLVILGGLAELFAGAISMGLGAVLASVTERKRYEIMSAKEKARWQGDGKAVDIEMEKQEQIDERSRGTPSEIRTSDRPTSQHDGASSTPDHKQSEESAVSIPSSTGSAVHGVTAAPPWPTAEKELRTIFNDYGVRTKDITGLAQRLHSDDKL
ncbi:CCC1-like protein 1 [Elsinoe fawcettii]|nr:CCC1-like protein 1 [Elsinoe fawcettii]